jgi:hypothetical protein
MRALFLIAVIGACSMPDPQSSNAVSSPWDDATLTLQRHACQGNCRVYAVTVTGYGDVEYEGVHAVGVVGTKRARVDAEDVHALFERLARANVFADPERSVYCFDDPRGVITMKHNGVVREAAFSEVPECNGKLGARPIEIAAAIDAVLETDAWTRCPENAGGECLGE